LPLRALLSPRDRRENSKILIALSPSGSQRERREENKEEKRGEDRGGFHDDL